MTDRGHEAPVARPGLGRRAVIRAAAGLAAAVAGLAGRAAAAAAGDRRIVLVDSQGGGQGGQRFAGVYRDGAGPRPEAMAAISALLRDRRTGEVRTIDPALIDILAGLAGRLAGGGSGSAPGTEIAFIVLSGYRSPQTNVLLARTSRWVAVNSLHMQGRAIDIRVAGVTSAALHAAALEHQSGGIGHYPSAGFVHLDTGPVRRWTAPGEWEHPAVRDAARRLRLPPEVQAPGVRTPGLEVSAPRLGGLELGAPAGGAPSLGGQSLGGAPRRWP